ncbi:hypothetical protein HY993_04335, partial [Candidatus Micrarchaeota archaeon]|nr:hypothetical protein [Candidatus Micrarchaeota archaeon]
MLINELKKAGFTLEQATRFYKKAGLDGDFKNKKADEFIEKIRKAAEAYSATENKIRQKIVQHPRFITYDHERAIRRLTKIYASADAVKKAILKHPAFAGYDHERVIKAATGVYGNEAAVKKAILKFPAFAGYDHERVIKAATGVYGNEAAVKKAILKFPAF